MPVLAQLEQESIRIIREAVADRPAAVVHRTGVVALFSLLQRSDDLRV